MRLAILLTTGALAAAAPALAQTGTAPVTQTSPSTTSTTTTTSSTTAPADTTGAATTAPVDTAAAPQVVQPAVGVTVYDPAGTSVGTIKSMDAQFVTLQTANGPVRLPAKGVGPGPKGAVIGLSAADLNAQVAQAAAAQPAATSSTADSAGTGTTTETQSTTTTKHKTRRHR